MKLYIFLILILFSACKKEGKINSTPINNFNVNKYLGDWYEIARTENKFEKGCENVKANYSLRKDGGVDVINKCFINNKEKLTKGRAFFKKSPNIGALKVTFFWPFYGDYNVLYVDDNYQYAIVYGGTKHYLWILSRAKLIEAKTLEMLLKKITQSGFDTNDLIYSKRNY